MAQDSSVHIATIDLNTNQEFQEKHKNDKPDIFGFSELNGEKFDWAYF